MKSALSLRDASTGSDPLAGRRVISAIEASQFVAVGERWVAPSLFTQINGFAGWISSAIKSRSPVLLKAVNGLQAAGCGQFLLTLMTDRWETMLKRLADLVASGKTPRFCGVRSSAAFGRAVSLSEPGFAGRITRLMIDPTVEHIRQARESRDLDPVL